MGICDWIIPKKKQEIYKYSIYELIFEILKNRNIDDIDAFLYDKNTFSDPCDFVDMDVLVKRLKKAIDIGEKICVYGDYDADGITATALMYSYLKSKGANVTYFIPDREKDGYGLSMSSIDRLKNKNIRLIFTVDNGISSFEEVKYARSLNIDTIITDHHRTPEKIPEAVAVVNPMRKDCRSKFKNFSGVGVAFKVVEAMESENKNIHGLLSQYSDLVTIGTIGDSIELFNETRNVVRIGLKNISESKRPGIIVILKKCGLYGKNITSTNVSFNIVPKINAPGRIYDASLSLKLLLSNDELEAEKIYQEIHMLNEKRKKLEKDIVLQIEDYIQKNPYCKYRPIIIVYNKGWHHGVIGIASSKITDKYGKPSILITYDDNDARGSCRSIDGFCIHTAITSCSSSLCRYGGHPMAAGINLKTENIKNFEIDIINYCYKYDDFPYPKLNLDFEIYPEQICLQMVQELQKLEPFGTGNPQPIFYIKNMLLQSVTSIGEGKHLRLRFKDGASIIKVVYFNNSEKNFLYEIGDLLDLAVTLNINTYKNKNEVSIYLLDIKLSNVNMIEVLNQKRRYENFKSGNMESIISKPLYFKRNDFVILYTYLKNNQKKNHRVDVLIHRIGWKDCDIFKLYILIDVLEELGIIFVVWNADTFEVSINKVRNKINLKNSKIISDNFKWEGQ